jgi:hypothetical protein
MVSIIHVVYGTVEGLRTGNTFAVLLFVHLGLCFGSIGSFLNVSDAYLIIISCLMFDESGGLCFW